MGRGGGVEGVGLEKVNFFYSEFKFKIDFFFGRRGGRGWLEQVNIFFAESPYIFLGGWGWGGGGGPGVGRGWRTGGGGWWMDRRTGPSLQV